MAKDTCTYTLTIEYKDGMIARFDYNKEQIVWEIAQRVMSNEAFANVKSWEITPKRNSNVNEQEGRTTADGTAYSPEH